MASGEQESGVIVGGADGGHLMMWDPTKIMDDGEDAVLFQSQKHVGPVQSLDFNPFQVSTVPGLQPVSG